MSDIREQIHVAVANHAAWKSRLREAARGDLRVDAQELAADDRCEFGRWLCGLENTPFAIWPHYREVVRLHREFHRVAGEVAARIVTGDRVAALALLSPDSEYTAASTSLTARMVEWAAALSVTPFPSVTST
jgi:hypothetical protein